MKVKLTIILVAILIISTMVVYATESQQIEEPIAVTPKENITQEAPIEQPVTTQEVTTPTVPTGKDLLPARTEESDIIERLKNKEVYGSNGYKQDDTLANYLSNENGYQDVLMANGIEGVKVDITNVSFGRVFGICTIDLTALDKAVVDGTLETSVTNILDFSYDKYVELKYENLLLGLINIDANGNIKKISDITMFNKESVKKALNSGSSNQEIYIVAVNKYLSGIVVNDGTSEYVLKDNGFGDYTKIELLDALKQIDDVYLTNNPRIDYEAIEAQQQAMATELAKRNQKMNIITYSILGVLVVAIIVIVLICWKKFMTIDE